MPSILPNHWRTGYKNANIQAAALCVVGGQRCVPGWPGLSLTAVHTGCAAPPAGLPRRLSIRNEGLLVERESVNARASVCPRVSAGTARRATCRPRSTQARLQKTGAPWQMQPGPLHDPDNVEPCLETKRGAARRRVAGSYLMAELATHPYLSSF